MTCPIILGLTGSIGMGKSTTAEMFRTAGVPVWDVDATVAALYAKGGDAVDPIRALFPDVVSQNSVDRGALKTLIAEDSSVLDQITAIVHPLVRANRDKFIDAMQSEPLILLDVPLLYETGLNEQVHKVVVVTTSADQQEQRVLARDKMTSQMFQMILSKQMPDSEKRAKADYVIETPDLDTARAAVHAIIHDLKDTS